MALAVNSISMQLLVLFEFLTQYFNKLFDTGTIPLGWSEAVIQPIRKKGDISSPDNYRGISLLNVSGKLYRNSFPLRMSKKYNAHGNLLA